MKQITLLLAFLFVGLASYGQSTIVFRYDDSGNRVSRNTTIGLKSTSPDNEVEVLPDSFSEKIGDSRVLIYPNPVESELNISIEAEDENQEVLITLYDNSGRLLLTREVTDKHSLLNLSHLVPGNYFMNVFVNRDVSQWTIVKE